MVGPDVLRKNGNTLAEVASAHCNFKALLGWRDLSLYFGRLFPGAEHRHPAHQMILSLSGAFCLQVDDGNSKKIYKNCTSAVIKADTHRQILSGLESCVVLYFETPVLDVHSEPKIRSRLNKEGCVTNNGTVEEFRVNMSEIVHSINWRKSSKSPDKFFELLGIDIMQWLLDKDLICFASESRISKALSVMSENRLTSLTELAGALHLSPTRVRQLFRSDLYTSFTQYRKWKRIKQFLVGFGRGDNMANACHDFADQSHLVRTFRSLFGIPPGCLFKEKQHIDMAFYDYSLSKILVSNKCYAA